MKTSIFFSILCFLISCESAPTNFEGGVARDESEMVALKSRTIPLSAEPIIVAQEKTSADRKLVKTGYLNIVVDKVAKTKTEIEKICKEYDAYVSSETQNTFDERLEYEQVIRVPAASFDVFVQKLETLASNVKNKNIQTSDVTEEFIDKEARIKTKKELEIRYREILKQASEVSDILSIESQLNQVRADIESMEGRLNYLRSQVAFSTLTLSFYEPIGAEFGFGSKTVAAFSNGWDMLLLFIIGLLNLWPFLIIVSLILVFILRKTGFSKILRKTPQSSEEI